MKTVSIIMAWVLLVGSIVAWPVSMFTFAKDEAPVTLSLSWFAVTLTAVTYLEAALVHKDQDKEK